MRRLTVLLAATGLTALAGCGAFPDYSNMTQEQVMAAEAQRRATLSALKDLGNLLDDQYSPSPSYSSDPYTGHSSDPYASSYGASGNDCHELQANFNRDYQDFHGTGSMCAIYTHEYQVRSAYRNALVSNGCVGAGAWDNGVAQASRAARAACE